MHNIPQKYHPHRIRPPAAAGLFYPIDPVELRKVISHFLHEANQVGPVPKGLIGPHAGYPYSGAIAASGYALLEPIRKRIKRVVLMGPSHRVPFIGLATSRADAFATPLGTIPLDQESTKKLLTLPQVQVLDEAHRQEHSLEVHLPWLQMSLDEFSLVPLVIGQARTEEVAEVIEALWGGDETLLVVSSDLSHYHDWQTAQVNDNETSHRIEGCQWRRIDRERACGYLGICGLLKVAEGRNRQVKALDLCNSGDTQGEKDRVVGYGSYVLT